MYPHLSYSAIYFLPDAQWETPTNISMDAMRCEAIGYTYYASGNCPANQNQETCAFNDKYLKCDGSGWCVENGYTLSSCTSPKIVSNPCPSDGSLYKSCECPSTYKYTCSGTGYNSGVGEKCGNEYTECLCSQYYSWNGSTCVHTHSYVCPSGYKESNSGMIEPASTAKVCQLSGCSSTSGLCYKEGHSHSYVCPSGSYASSSSCSYGTSGTVSKVCSCGATSGTCYTCNAAPAHTHSYACTSGYSETCTNGYSDTASKTCSCGAISGTCYACCSTDYKYKCDGTGEAGSGTACGGKYKLCVCTSNYVSFCNVTFCS